MIRKIARSGLKGRKKDSFLLVFVISLSFVFIVSAILLHSSSEKTKYEQRFNMFGKWQGSLLNIMPNKYDKDVVEDLSNDSNIRSLGISSYIGKSDNFGHVMTINDEMASLGNFKLLEGSMPKGPDEIVIELNQLSFFKNPISVGDTVEVATEITLFERDETEAMEALNKAFLESINHSEDYYQTYYKENKNEIDYALEASKDYLESLFKDVEDEEEKLALMIKEVVGWFTIFPTINRRNEQELEEFNGTRVLTRTSYMYYPGASSNDSQQVEDNIETIRRNGVMVSQRVIISRPMKVSGIIETYSKLWDTKDAVVANAFVSEETGKLFLEEGFYKTQYDGLVIDIDDYSPPLNIFIESNMDVTSFIKEYKDKYPDLERNSLAFPELAGSTEGTLTYSIVAFVFVATVFAVLQIYLTQMRRRTRKLALLKSIGATNSQIVQLIAWEGVYLLIIGLFFGVLGGFALAKGLIAIMNQNEITNLVFDVNYRLLVFGLLIGILAVVIGILLPIIMAVNIPLTGRITKPPKHKNSSLKLKSRVKSKDVYKLSRQSFFKISLRHMAFNKSKYLITTLLYTVTITVLLSSVFLAYLFFQDYINQVIVVDKPNYGYEVIFGMPNREIREVVEEIESVDGVVSVDVYKGGEHAYMWYETINDHEVYPVFKDLLPTYLQREHFGMFDEYSNTDSSNEHLIKDSIITNIYGIDVDRDFNKITKHLTMGSLNKEEFKAGNEVVVLMPMYRLNKDIPTDKISDLTLLNNTNFKNRMKIFSNVSGAFDLSYDFRFKDIYDLDSSLKVGDTIYLTVATEELEGEVKLNEVASYEALVSGIIHYFPEIGMWPFADSLENPVVIGSNSLVGKLYPATIYGPGRYFYNNGTSYLQNLIDSIFPTKFGKTFFYIKTNDEVDDLDIFVDLQRIAVDRDFKFINYQENINAVFAKAFNFTSIIGVLGIVIAGISLIILYNTTLSKIEQERDRIGILQALGVTSKQFKLLYLLTGLFSAIIALIVGHGILSLIIYFTMDYSLWLYPIKIHIGISIAFIILATLVYYMPIRKIIKNQPVYNIRSLSR